MIYSTGFKNVTIQKDKPIYIPDDILEKYLDKDALAAFRNGDTGIFSITVFAEKPVADCKPGGGCC
jgi:hypothetical protein